MRQVVIVHGWSDTSKSFSPLVEFLRSHGFDPIPIWLGDYISMSDEVRIEDVGRRMEQVVRERISSGVLDGKFDLIVHSTGGLVAREWISAHYSNDIGSCPCKRLIMLAPANFGSPLASMGKSMLGRLVKGWNNWFHTGTEMLNALELSSPYQWDLAQRDLFVPEGPDAAPALYGTDGVWPFVIVGSHPYTQSLRKITNENGGDGTVRAAGANMNARGVTIDFSVNEREPEIRPWRLRDGVSVPLAVLPDRTHGSIISPDAPDVQTSPEQSAVLGQAILRALACESVDDYSAIEGEWNALTEETASLMDETARLTWFKKGASEEFFHQYMQINVLVVDDQGAEVKDYFLEFSGPDNEKGNASMEYFHGQVLENVHVNSQSASYRCLYVDRTDLVNNYYGLIPGEVEKVLNLSISASSPGENVSYFDNYKRGAAGTVPVHRLDSSSSQPRWLKRNATHFVKIVIPRKPSEKVFRLTKARCRQARDSQG